MFRKWHLYFVCWVSVDLPNIAHGNLFHIRKGPLCKVEQIRAFANNITRADNGELVSPTPVVVSITLLKTSWFKSGIQ
jgi:hypothetical protein